MRKTKMVYRPVPLWAWNDELQPDELRRQIRWMHDKGIGGFFMHARSGLKTEYLGEKWFECVDVCVDEANKYGMEVYAYDEDGWPSGFCGGKFLDDVETHDMYLTHSYGAYDKDSFASYDYSGPALRRVTDGSDVLNVYMKYSGGSADILNGDVVDKFISLTHEEYGKHDVNRAIRGFFTDEPQYYRWDTPYSKKVGEYFAGQYGEDIRDGIGLLFIEKEGYREFRYKYWKAMQTLMLKNFAEKIYLWCEEKGYKLTGHYIEESRLDLQMLCCAGIMPFYEFEHIPGIDWLCRHDRNEIMEKQVGSVAAQLGKERVLSESFGCCGWGVTPLDLKRMAELQYVGGVNLLCQHFVPYAEYGQRKRDYPAHFTDLNPWIKKNFNEYNDFISVLSELMSESEDVADVGVLHPLRSAYFGYKRTLPHTDGFGVKELDDAFAELFVGLTEAHIPHHFIDETILARHGSVTDGKLKVGRCSYKYVVIPRIYTMDKTTDALLGEFVKEGGKLLVTGAIPEYLECEKHEYPYLSSNVTMEEIRSAQPLRLDGGKDIRVSLRRDGDGKYFIYAVNSGARTSAEFSFGDARSFLEYDVFGDRFVRVGKTLSFDKGQSRILYPDDMPAPAEKKKAEMRLGGTFEVVGEVKNFLTLDFASYSTDGKTYRGPLHCMCIQNELLDIRYSGDVHLRYAFYVDEIPGGETTFVAETPYIKSICLNGDAMRFIGPLADEPHFGVYAADGIVKGKNVIDIVLDFYENANVYHALYGDAGGETFVNSFAYDTTVEAIYLRGAFGVFGDFDEDRKIADGASAVTVTGRDFRIGKAKRVVSDLIRDGYPFLAGDITLRKKVNVWDKNCEFYTDKPFQMLEFKVNGKSAGTMMMSCRKDLSEYLVSGENELEITLTVGNRNLFGPFHLASREATCCVPFDFDRFGSWRDGKSDGFTEDYNFLKTLV